MTGEPPAERRQQPSPPVTVQSDLHTAALIAHLEPLCLAKTPKADAGDTPYTLTLTLAVDRAVASQIVRLGKNHQVRLTLHLIEESGL